MTTALPNPRLSALLPDELRPAPGCITRETYSRILNAYAIAKRNVKAHAKQRPHRFGWDIAQRNGADFVAALYEEAQWQYSILTAAA